MVKNRIVTQITQKTGMAKSKNADNTLADLRAKYYIFAKNLKFLITSLTTNHACMVGYSKARLDVAKAINSLTVDTPLFGCAGDITAASVGTVDGGGAPGDNNNSSTTDLVITNSNTNNSKDSYAAIHLALHRKNKLYHDKYTEHILSYATEWERILTTRINGHLKQSETLRVDLDHYAKKVEDLHKTINKTMTKGKPVSDDNVDKLKRNEAKLIQARAEYDRFVNDLCGYMEEVMIRGWKDLHPLLVKMAQFDTTLCNEESLLFTKSMTSVTDRLKNMKNHHPGLTPLGRLKELETASLESIARCNPDYGVIVQGGGEAATFAPLGGSSTTTTTTIGGGGLFSTLMTSSSDELPLDSNHSSDAVGGGGGLYGQTASAPSSGNYDWTRGSGGGGGGGGNFIAPAPSSGSGYDWATGGGGMGGGRGVPSIAPSEMVDRRRTGVYGNNPTSPQMSSMIMAMQHAPPPPTLGDIYDLNNGGSSSNAPPAPPAQQQQQYYGARPPMPPAPPPSMPPPPPPTPTNNNMMTSNFSQMSMYGASQQGGGGGSGTNPFGDDSSQVSYGAPPQQGYSAPPPSYGAPQQGYGAPTQQASYGQQQQQQAPYGAQY